MSISTDTLNQQLIERLSYAGLLPFVLLATLLWLVDAELLLFVSSALASYGALIAAFLGGLHWGVAFVKTDAQRTFHLCWGVVPSLVGWLALMMPPYAGLPLLGLVLLACYAVDRKTYPGAGLGGWLPLRLRVTAAATACCVLGAAAI